MTSRRRSAVVFVVALTARAAVVLWAAPRFPPTADGAFYHAFADRLARGLGYTWAWPDGAVTYAAHYPVGYPALLAPLYALLGPRAGVAMTVNALVGAAGAASAERLGARHGPRVGLAAGLAVALHPALVPYTAAVMTEGVTASLLLVAAACADAEARRAWTRSVAAGVVMGIATLVRPQCLVLAPALGWLGARSRSVSGGARSAVAVTAITLAVCAPWTARNCVRMHRCALVSVNAGWNLLIGEATTTGAWEPVVVPPECSAVWDEAEKDRCFERAAKSRIAASPASWIARAPAKLGVTFDYFGGAPWYLHASNGWAFSETAKWRLGAVETIASRALLLGALAAAWRLGRLRDRGARASGFRAVIAAVAATLAVTERHAWIAYLLLAALLLVTERDPSRRLLPWWTACTIFATAATHAVFFGAGRYGLVVAPLVAAVAALSLRPGGASPPASTAPSSVSSSSL